MCRQETFTDSTNSPNIMYLFSFTQAYFTSGHACFFVLSWQCFSASRCLLQQIFNIKQFDINSILKRTHFKFVIEDIHLNFEMVKKGSINNDKAHFHLRRKKSFLGYRKPAFDPRRAITPAHSYCMGCCLSWRWPRVFFRKRFGTNDYFGRQASCLNEAPHLSRF